MKKNTTTIKTVVVMAGNTVHDRPTDTHTHTHTAKRHVKSAAHKIRDKVNKASTEAENQQQQ